MWEVRYSQEAGTYLEDNGQLITALFFAMESLADSDGIPTNESFQVINGLMYWSVHDYGVVYRRIESSEMARILFIKPK